MTYDDAANELESPPEAICQFYPRFASACALGAVALRRDENAKRGDLAGMYKKHLDFIYDGTGAKSPEEVVEMANDGGKA